MLLGVGWGGCRIHIDFLQKNVIVTNPRTIDTAKDRKLGITSPRCFLGKSICMPLDGKMLLDVRCFV